MVEATTAAASLVASPSLSFAAVVSNGCSSPRAKAKSFDELLSNGKLQIKNPGVFKGEPAVFFTKEEIISLASPFRFALIGKFSFGRPPMAVIRKFFSSLGLKSLKSVGLLQENHVIIFINQEEDYSRLILRSIWYVSGSPMKIIKWSPDFFPSYESPVVPVWTAFPGLPIHLFDKSVLYSLASIFGTPLKLDEPTVLLTRPTVARICIEMDVSKPRNQRIWIGSEKEGFWQEVVFENPPSYCDFCKMIGHEENLCYSKNPSLKKSLLKEGKNEPIHVLLKEKEIGKEVWKEKSSTLKNDAEWQVVKRKGKLPSVSKTTSPSFNVSPLKPHSDKSKQGDTSLLKQKEVDNMILEVVNAEAEISPVLNIVTEPSFSILPTVSLTPFNQKKVSSKPSIQTQNSSLGKQKEKIVQSLVPSSSPPSLLHSPFSAEKESSSLNVLNDHNLSSAPFDNSSKISPSKQKVGSVRGVAAPVSIGVTAEKLSVVENQNERQEIVLQPSDGLQKSASRPSISENCRPRICQLDTSEELILPEIISHLGVKIEKTLVNNGSNIQGKLDSGSSLDGLQFVDQRHLEDGLKLVDQSNNSSIDFKGLAESSPTDPISLLMDKLFTDGKTWEKLQLRRSKRNKKKKIHFEL